MSLPAIPHETLHAVNGELMGVLALLHGAMDALEAADLAKPEEGGITSPASRATALLLMACTKVRGSIHSMGPHV